MSKQSLLFPKRQSYFRSSYHLSTEQQVINTSGDLPERFFSTKQALNSDRKSPSSTTVLATSIQNQTSVKESSASKIESLKSCRDISRTANLSILFQNQKNHVARPPLHQQMRTTSPKCGVNAGFEKVALAQVQLQKGNQNSTWDRNMPIKAAVLGSSLQNPEEQEEEEVKCERLEEDAKWKVVFQTSSLEWKHSQQSMQSTTYNTSKRSSVSHVSSVVSLAKGAKLTAQPERKSPVENEFNEDFSMDTICNETPAQPLKNPQEYSVLPRSISSYSTPKKAKPSFVRRAKPTQTVRFQNEGAEEDRCDQEEELDDEEAPPLFSRTQQQPQMLDCRTRATSASKLKVFSTQQAEQMVDGKIQEVVEAVDSKKRLEKKRNDLKCLVAQRQQEAAALRLSEEQQRRKCERLKEQAARAEGELRYLRQDLALTRGKVEKIKREAKAKVGEMAGERNELLERVEKLVEENEAEFNQQEYELLEQAKLREVLGNQIFEAQSCINELQKKVKNSNKNIDKSCKNMKDKGQFLNEIVSKQKFTGLTVAKKKASVKMFSSVDKTNTNSQQKE